MIIENLSPAIAALSVPKTDDEAVARITEYTAEYPSGIIGLKFHDFDQFLRAMKECGYSIEVWPYMTSITAITWIGIARRREKDTKFIAHCWRVDDHCQIINSLTASHDEAAPPQDPRKKEKDKNPIFVLKPVQEPELDNFNFKFDPTTGE